MDSYAFARFLLLSHATFATLTSFSFPNISITPGRRFPSWSRIAVRLALSTLTGCSWSRSTLAPATTVLWTACFTCWSSVSSRHATRIRAEFLGSLFTARHRQPSCSPAVRISLSIVCLIFPGCVSVSFPSTLDVSIVQYRVAVVGAGWAGSAGSISPARAEAYDHDGDPLRGFDTLFVNPDLFLVTDRPSASRISVFNSWTLVVANCSLVSVS